MATAVTFMRDWSERDVARAREEIAARDRKIMAEEQSPGWRCCWCLGGATKAQGKDIITAALSTVAGFAVGKVVKKLSDPEGKLNTDTKVDTTWSTVMPVTVYTIFVVLPISCLVVYRLHRAIDNYEQQLTENRTTVDGGVESYRVSHAEATPRQRRISAESLRHAFIAKAVDRAASKWTKSTMFTWAVILHSYVDPVGSERAVFQLWCNVALMVCICFTLTFLVLETPIRLHAMRGWRLNLDRMEKVEKVVTKAVAVLVAVSFMEAWELTVARWWIPEQLSRVTYYWASFHGLGWDVRLVGSLPCFFASGVGVFALRRNEQRAKQCYKEEKDLAEMRKRAMSVAFPKDLTSTMKKRWYRCYGGQVRKMFKQLKYMMSYIGALSLQRLIMAWITPSSWLWEPCGHFPSGCEGKWRLWGSEPPQPHSSSPSLSGNATNTTHGAENATAGLPQLVTICGHVIKRNVSTLPDLLLAQLNLTNWYEVQPSPPPSSPQASHIPSAKCKSVNVYCSVFKGLYEGCYKSALEDNYCFERPLYGDTLLLVAFASICTVLCIWIVAQMEIRLRHRLVRALDVTAEFQDRDKAGSKQLPAMSITVHDGACRILAGVGTAANRVNQPTVHQPLSINPLSAPPAESDGELRVKRKQLSYEVMLTLVSLGNLVFSWLVGKTWSDVLKDVLRFHNIGKRYAISVAIATTFLAVYVPKQWLFQRARSSKVGRRGKLRNKSSREQSLLQPPLDTFEAELEPERPAGSSTAPKQHDGDQAELVKLLSRNAELELQVAQLRVSLQSVHHREGGA